MQDNLQDKPSSLFFHEGETFNIIPRKKKLSYMYKNELPLTLTSYSIVRMKFTQVEI